MLTYILRRLLIMVPTVFLISVFSFFIIQLPPGDYLTSMIANLMQTGEEVDQAVVASLRERYGLDQPFFVQYLKWMGGVLRGDSGQSFAHNKPVSTLIWERLGYTMLISVLSILVTWMIALPIGIYSATHQYTPFDYVVTFLGFAGMATPNFLLALVLLALTFNYLGVNMSGLFSPEYMDAPWTLGKVADLTKHLIIPVFILSVSGTAGMIRTMRANLLDQLRMPYVETARAKGLSEWRLILKYPVRIAINPMVSTIGWLLPVLISGEVIVSMVLSLPTTGPLLLSALMDQDMYLAGSIVLILSVLTVAGTLLSDVLLAWVDPRIRFERQQT